MRDTGRVALVTGAASGIGKATATGLAREGFQVTLLVRNRERGEEAVRDISSVVPGARLDVLACDLSSQESIRVAAKEFLSKHAQLHALVNSAGVFRKTRNVTVDGLEETFATNYLAYFLLTNLLLPALKAGAPSRIVNVSSRYSNGPWVSKVDFDDLQTEKGKYSVARATPPTMVARVLFTQELAARLEGTGVVANAVHPGLVRGTRLLNDVGGLFRWMTNAFGSPPEKGADTVLWLATAPEAANVTGKLWANRKPLPTPGQGMDPSARKRLWDESVRLTKL